MKNENHHQLLELLQSLLNASQKMKETLQDEQDFLTAYDNEGILHVTATKKQITALIENHTKTLHKHLLNIGVPRGLYNLSTYLEQLTSTPDTKHLIKLWAGIEAFTIENKTANETNGAIVELNRRHAQRSLDVLRGQSGASIMDTYGSDGHAKKGKISRNISIV